MNKKGIRSAAVVMAAMLVLTLVSWSTSKAEKPKEPKQQIEKDGGKIALIPDLPKTIKTLPGVKKENKALKNLIIKYFEIPKEYLEVSKYYYNYVDLNSDKKKEIFAVVMGPYTSGTGGSTALIVKQQKGRLKVIQSLTLVNTPVIVSNEKTNGYKDIVVPYYGGGAESAYSAITYSKGRYSNVSDGAMLDSLTGIKGTAIIYNDLAADMESGDFHTLGGR